ncbi:hypothetical protein PPACK8108_LOCUS19579 [Phakopsora pachyrhizi]|uniref:SUN domain-containing protein n=1 Tax=Phakopsora pachyrhizi TaxID=170000 RepID=A0AAV0BES0_PHAPC|nr:hypothetical protein PPACK8108_LOCUS19579 [Phakopsora pachyrhizi]
MPYEPDLLFPPEFTSHLRRFSRHITTVQTRYLKDDQPHLLFGSSSHQPVSETIYPPSYDSYDLEICSLTDFRPNLLVSNIERIFLTVVPLWKAGLNEIQRITTWREPRRTALWAFIYSVCWINGVVLPGFILLLICLSIWPRKSSAILFPPEGTTSEVKEGNSSIQTEPTPLEEEFAQVAAATASAYVNDSEQPEIIPKGTNATVGESESENHGLPQNLKKGNILKSEKKSLTEQFKPIIYKYGGAIQNIAGAISDGHERGRNLFLQRFVPPPSTLRNSNHSVIDSSSSYISEFDPNLRLGLILIPILSLTLVLSSENLGRCVTLAIGIALFLLNPLQQRSQTVKDLLDINKGLLRGVPTDRAWILATLRNMNQRQKDGLDIAMKLLVKPESTPLPDRRAKKTKSQNTTTDLSPKDPIFSSFNFKSDSPSTNSFTDSSSSSSNSNLKSNNSTSSSGSKRNKILNFTKRFNQMTERGTQILNSSRPLTVEISDLLSQRQGKKRFLEEDQIDGEDLRIDRSISSQINGSIRRIFSLNADNYSDMTRGTEILPSGQEFSLTRFFCYYGNLPGYLTIHSPMMSNSIPKITFYSAIGKNLKVVKSIYDLPLNRIVGMRKTNLLDLFGVWLGIDGLEILERVSKKFEKDLNKKGVDIKMKDSYDSSNFNHHHNKEQDDDDDKNFIVKSRIFKNLKSRDEAFLRILVLKSWNSDEESGWITV